MDAINPGVLLCVCVCVCVCDAPWFHLAALVAEDDLKGMKSSVL